MKTSERFNRAISALVKGYFDNTLGKGSPCGCAIGNIIAASRGCQIVDWHWEKDGIVRPSHWTYVFMTTGSGVQYINPDLYILSAKGEIDSTGYSWQELAKVEKAFELATNIYFPTYPFQVPEEVDADQLAGLMAVTQVLCEIEGIEDPAPYQDMFQGKQIASAL